MIMILLLVSLQGCSDERPIKIGFVAGLSGRALACLQEIEQSVGAETAEHDRVDDGDEGIGKHRVDLVEQSVDQPANGGAAHGSDQKGEGEGLRYCIERDRNRGRQHKDPRHLRAERNIQDAGDFRRGCRPEIRLFP